MDASLRPTHALHTHTLLHQYAPFPRHKLMEKKVYYKEFPLY